MFDPSPSSCYAFAERFYRVLDTPEIVRRELVFLQIEIGSNYLPKRLFPPLRLEFFQGAVFVAVYPTVQWPTDFILYLTARGSYSTVSDSRDDSAVAGYFPNPQECIERWLERGIDRYQSYWRWVSDLVMDCLLSMMPHRSCSTSLTTTLRPSLSTN